MEKIHHITKVSVQTIREMNQVAKDFVSQAKQLKDDVMDIKV